MQTSRKIHRFITFVLLAGLVLCQPNPAQGADPQAPQACPTSVQVLISQTDAGGTLNLPACTNNENLKIDKDLTIIGNSSGGTILTGLTGAPVITLTGVHMLKLENLEITGGSFPGKSGGAVLADQGSLEIVNSYLHHNSASYGGTIFQGVVTSTLTVTGSRIEQNSASVHGGGIYARGAVTLTNTDVLSNTAVFSGGGVASWVGPTLIQGGSFTGNRAYNQNGGAVNVNNGLTVQRTTFTNNTAGDSGGAITQWNAGNPVSITYSTFNGNHAKNQGGGVFVNSVVTFDHDTFTSNTVSSGNTTNTYGGGVYAGNTGRLEPLIGTSVVTVLDSTFTNNIVNCTGCFTTGGGGIYSDGDISHAGAVTTSIQRSTFKGNQAWYGGGVFANYHKLLVDSSTFDSNSGGYGGGIDAYILQGEDLAFLKNHVINGGAGLYAYDLTLSRSRFMDNAGGNDGGSAIDIGSKASLTNLLLVNNNSLSDGAIGMNPRTTGVFRNLTITRAVPGNAIAVKIASTSTITMENTIITNHTTEVDLFGTLIENDNLYYQNSGVNVKPELGSSHLPGGNIILGDPRFANPAGGDYHLQAGSPAIAGGVYFPSVNVDLDNRPRWPGRSAMGAYNFAYYGFLPGVRK